MDEVEDNPLARATRNLLSKGQRFERVALAALRVNAGEVRWIGMFVKSAGDRLVFFPGFTAPYDRLATNDRRNRGTNVDISFVLDHITLEKNLKKWHFTEAAETGGHEKGGRTLDVGEGRVLWFGMTINGHDVLRVVRSATVARGNSPNDKEVRDRVSCFNQAVKDGQGIELLMPAKPPTPCVLHFAVIAAPHGAPMYAGPNVALPQPYVTLGAHKDHPATTGQMALSGDRDVQIVAFWAQGPSFDFDGLWFTAPT